MQLEDSQPNSNSQQTDTENKIGKFLLIKSILLPVSLTDFKMLIPAFHNGETLTNPPKQRNPNSVVEPSEMDL
jgi:hypothetical protein